MCVLMRDRMRSWMDGSLMGVWMCVLMNAWIDVWMDGDGCGCVCVNVRLDGYVYGS